jgi:ankyrin repeat protein
VNMPDRIGLTPLMRVARGMAAERYRRNSMSEPGLLRRSAMELLLQHGADIRLRDHAGWTALLYASENEPADGVKILLQHGADPNIAVKGRTPLRNAAYRGLVANLQALLAAGAKAGPNDLSDAMMQATLTGHDAAVQFLIDHGADVNFCDQYGMTPLMLAIANDHLSTGKLLVQCGADTRIRDLLGKTAIDYAQPGRTREIHTDVFGDLRLRRF